MRHLYSHLSAIFITAMLFLVMHACIKMPESNVISTVTYTFNGGSDLLSIFDLTANYVNSDKQMASEKIVSLPWTITQQIKAPYEVAFDVSFVAKSNILPAEFYRVGFDGEIIYKNQKQLKNQKQNTKSGEERDILKFSIDYPTASIAEQATLIIPNLKFNKHFAYSYTADDASVGAYAKLWRRINKRWIDDVDFFHKQCLPSTGYMPTNTLGFTDGCGNERRFPVAVAIWPNVKTIYQPNGMMEESSFSIYLPYITWEELEDIVDYKGAVYYHNVDEDNYDNTDVNQIMKGLNEDNDKTYNRLGRKMKIMSQPDDNPTYLDAFNTMSNIVMVRTDSNSPMIYLNDIHSLDKSHLYSGFSEDYDQLLLEIGKQSLSQHPYWISFSTHGVSNEVISLFESINNEYGKDGADNIWFATIEEIYEYVFLKNNSIINKRVDGSKVIYEVSIPKSDDFYYKELSFCG